MLNRLFVTIFLLYPLILFGRKDEYVILDFRSPSYNQSLKHPGKHILIRRGIDAKSNKTNSIFIGNEADFSNSEFEVLYDLIDNLVDSAIDFSNVHFAAKLNFDSAQFDVAGTFMDVQFDSSCTFAQTNFKSAISWNNAKFKSSNSFFRTNFKSECDFEGAEFDSECDFIQSVFSSTSNFKSAHFNSDCNFLGSKFLSESDFYGAYFEGNARFDKCIFQGDCNFNHVNFNNENIFIKTVFDNKLILQSLRVTKNTIFDFTDAILPDTIDFSNNPIIFLGLPTTIDFSRANQKKKGSENSQISVLRTIAKSIKNYFYPFDTSGNWMKTRINLDNSDISKIKIDYDNFQPYFFSDKNTDSLTKDKLESLYEGLLKNFKDRGQIDSYEKLDLEHKRFEDKLAPKDFSVQDWWWRYGYEKWRIFIHSFLFILIFSSMNFFFLHKFNDKNHGVYHIDNIPEFSPYKFGFSYRRIGHFYKRFWYSMMYTSVIFFLLTLKIEKVRFYKPAVIWVMFVYTVGLICMGFMANLVLQK